MTSDISSENVSSKLLNGRYILHHKIGEGGMGIIYLATDRLTQKQVAFKRINFDLEKLDWLSSLSFGSNPKVVLANEFKILAGLRHPHIISVLDYGFDRENEPFYTMDYLANAESILEAGKRATFEEKINLIGQTLKALNYLHQRGILHRDLKPNNVLVQDGHVRLVDFGLASFKGQNGSSGGTLLYMSPEMIRENSESFVEATDLYSLGVMAYELLAGEHPFDINSEDFAQQVLVEEPDIRKLPVNQKLQSVIGRLLAKYPNQRFDTVENCLIQISDATGRSMIDENASIRNSFIQAARFVGRENELAQLDQALTNVKAGKGSAIFIGGESGSGKSRLLDEFRIQALVEGVQVFRGQEIKGGGQLYQSWRELVLHIAMNTYVSDIEASIIEEMSPRFRNIFQGAIEPVPQLFGSEKQKRFATILSQLLKRQSRPTLLLFEDIHWARESLDPIISIIPEIEQYPLLILGSFQTDERPELNAELPSNSKFIFLPRFDKNDVYQLVEVMLGRSDISAEFIEQLYVETEGNIYFLTETLRVWAEETGSRANVVQADVTKNILTGGMEEIIRRRLAKISPADQALLKVTAVSGRKIDLDLLNYFGGQQIDVERWLRNCADALIIEIVENNWQFAHDKLRELIIQDMVQSEVKQTHEQVAVAIETIKVDPDEFAVDLAYLWQKAENADKEIYYTNLASQQLAWSGNHEKSRIMIQRLFEKFDAEIPENLRLRLLRTLGKVNRERHNYREAQEVYMQGVDLSRKLDDQNNLMNHLIGLGWSIWRELQYYDQWDDVGRVTEAQYAIEEALYHAELLGDKRGRAKTLMNLGFLLNYQDGDFERGLQLEREALGLFEEAQDYEGMMDANNNIAHDLIRVGNGQDAKFHANAALELSKMVGNPTIIPFALEKLLRVGIFEADWNNAENYLTEFKKYLEPEISLIYPSIRNYFYQSFAACITFGQNNYIQSRYHGEKNIEQCQLNGRDSFFAWCQLGASAIMLNDSDLVRKCIKNTFIKDGKIATTNLAYLAMLQAGLYFLNDDNYRGAVWLNMGIDILEQAEMKILELSTHVTDVSNQLREKFRVALMTTGAIEGQYFAEQLDLSKITNFVKQFDVPIESGVQFLQAIEELHGIQ